MTESTKEPTILIAGASRGLGHAMAAEFLERGWRVIGTVRAGARDTPLHDLASRHADRLEIEILDICVPDQLTALDTRLSGRTLDMLFVNAGTTNRHPSQAIGDVSTDEFVDVMITNTLAPMRVIETLMRHLSAAGLIGAMSSGQGSIANNEQGDRELYRASKAALNQSMRCLAARHAESGHPMAVMAPGWVRTELGGPDGRFSIEESVPPLVDVLIAKRDRPGLEYLDRFGETVPW